MTDLKLRPPAKDLFYVTIDGTRAIDSLTIGRMWQKFGWRNLLDGLAAPAADPQRRTDSAHPALPIRFMQEARPGKTSQVFGDIVIMPEGRDGTGVDAGNWPAANKAGNVTQINDANNFVQGFILAPACDTASSALGRGSRTADLVYVSSHGVRTGDMFGEASNDIDKVDPFFILAKAAAGGGKFAAVKWLILSNCNTMVAETHNDWLTLMKASTGFRGMLGYHGASVPADPSAGANVSFVNQLLAGKSLKESWRQANKAWGMADRWVVICHDAAKDDTVAQWNAGALAGIPGSPPVIRLFDEANLAGVAVVPVPDPFGVSWSRIAAGVATRITPANRYDPLNKIADRDVVRISVAALPKAATFTAGTVVEVTLIFVREDYPEVIDIGGMFTITGSSGLAGTVGTAHRNASRADKGADTWIMVVAGTPAAISIDLRIDRLFIGNVHHNLPFWLRAKFTPPGSGGGGVPLFDFIHDAAVYSA